VIQENWSPAVNTVQVLSSVRQLLAKPNPDDPVRADVASLYINNRYKRGDPFSFP
jgi:ubiquitin-protein ligase